MKILATLFSLFLWLLGGIFILAAIHPDAIAQHKALPRVIVGVILVLAGFVLVVLAWIPWGKRGAGDRGGPAATSGGMGGQEAPGQLSLKPIVCPHCGGQVDASSAKLNPEGTLTVTCGYCKGAFLIQEEPKW
jgi:hypothetical protein